MGAILGGAGFGIGIVGSPVFDLPALADLYFHNVGLGVVIVFAGPFSSGFGDIGGEGHSNDSGNDGEKDFHDYVTVSVFLSFEIGSSLIASFFLSPLYWKTVRIGFKENEKRIRRDHRPGTGRRDTPGPQDPGTFHQDSAEHRQESVRAASF